MPRGYRYVILAAFGWLALANSQPDDRAQKQQKRADYHITDATNKPAKSKALPPVQTTRLSPPCQQPQDHSTCDLEAQWKAADAADKAAWWSEIQAILSAAGIAGLFYTLILTRRSTKAAIGTLDAQIATERPLMQLVNVSTVPMQGTALQPLKLNVVWTIQNFGKTGCWVESFSLTLHSGKRISFATEMVQIKFEIASFVAPDKTLNNDAKPAVFSFRKSGQNVIYGTQSVIASGEVTYRDPSARRWRTSFAMLVDMGPDFRSGQVHPYPSGEHWSDERVESG